MKASENQSSAGEANKLQFNASNVLLIFVLPWLVQCLWGFSYSSIALHYRSSGWPLWRLSMLAMSGNLLQPLLNGMVVNFGVWISAPFAIATSILVLPATIWPDSEAIVTIQLFVGYFVFLDLPLKTICFSQFSHSEDVLKEASRIQSLGCTTGYAVSPFIGGVVYDLWGWKGCAGMHLVCQSILSLGLCTSPGVWKDWERWQQARCLEAKMPSTVQVPQKRKSFISNAFPILRIPASIRLPCVAVALALAANGYAYQSEWSTYALYFREEHNWTSAMLAGVCQMAGDVVGALMLIVSARLTGSKPTKALSEHSEQQTRPRCPLLSKPYNLAMLLGAWVVLNMGLTMRSLHLAVISQVLMGTVFVFFLQWVNEMNMFYAFGDSETYAQIRTMTMAIFSTLCAIASGAALLLYDNVGRLMPFYMSAVVGCFVLVIYMIIFLPRARCAGNFDQIEEARHTQSLTGISPAASSKTVTSIISVRPAPANDPQTDA